MDTKRGYLRYLLGIPAGIIIMIIWHFLSVIGHPVLLVVVHLFFSAMSSPGPEGFQIPVYTEIGEWLATPGGNAILRVFLDFLWMAVAPWFFIPLAYRMKKPTLLVATVVCAPLSAFVWVSLFVLGQIIAAM
jgi:hypothetical protein